ncbi:MULTISPECIES: GNAT family N-acetyltransferase [unclassified Kribbella]|uniref:GNAT family N-acetyltransferase n=1 Tax=unclassified Kribbella TaxID=2644121 RepID=UPI00301873CD
MRTWVDDATLLAAFTKQHEEVDVLLATDLAIAAERAERFAPGQPAESMLNYWVPVGDLGVMFSMRFEGLDPSKPFVDATPMSRSPRRTDLPALAAAALEAYGVHHPRYVRLWSAEPRMRGTHPDRRFLGAPLSQLQPRDVPPGLALTRAEGVDHYDEAQQAYDAVDAAHPQHRSQATIQDRDDLQEAADAGLLFDVTVNGEWAGYVSVTLDNSNGTGLPSYVVQELILTPTHRGHGYGPHLSTLLAASLPDQSRILTGTIHAANTGARTAALNAGRQDIGGWLQLPLPHP